ncbi:MAG: hypothetical protein EBU90_03215 [Proteobacteria bacterium]|nr:hypothetical protein [Pseudomonadota bacterium]NBP13336.1 hypothetical protein [bacterium]
MKFLNLINNKFKELNEQVPGEVPGLGPTDPMAPAPAPVPPPAAGPAPEAGPKPLSPEGEVFLVRLLKKALFLNPGDIDEKMLKDLPEINETNASEVLNSIVEIMKKYSNSIDVDTENK